MTLAGSQGNIPWANPILVINKTDTGSDAQVFAVEVDLTYVLGDDNGGGGSDIATGGIVCGGQNINVKFIPGNGGSVVGSSATIQETINLTASGGVLLGTT